MHGMKMAFYLARLAVYRQLAFVRFFSKPGSRIIVPVALIGLAVLLRSDLHVALRMVLYQLDRGLRPEDIHLDVILAVLGVPIIYGYVLWSRALAVVLGAFPVGKRPLPPVRRLKPTTQDITSAVVRVVVPPLPRRRA